MSTSKKFGRYLTAAFVSVMSPLAGAVKANEIPDQDQSSTLQVSEEEVCVFNLTDWSASCGAQTRADIQDNFFIQPWVEFFSFYGPQVMEEMDRTKERLENLQIIESPSP